MGQSIMQAAVPATGMRVLVVDDSNTIRRSAEMSLRKAGYEVAFAEDGFAALPKVIEFRPALIFIDVMMPRLDGYATCALIKQHPEFRHIPVVLLTSKDSVFDRVRGRMAGADQYLIKPFSRESLLAAVNEHAPVMAGGLSVS
jgi:twitching motility two-component system response regulator PilG